MKPSKIITLIVGGIIGAALGVLTAFFFQKQLQRNEAHLKITAGQGIKVGTSLIHLLRTIFDIGRGK